MTVREGRGAPRAGNLIILLLAARTFSCLLPSPTVIGLFETTREALPDSDALVPVRKVPATKSGMPGELRVRFWRCKSSEVIEKADTCLWQEIWKNLVILTSFSDVLQILEL